MKARTIIFAGIALAAAASAALARIGETKQEIGDRMFAKTQRTYLYTSKEDKLREFLELPYKNKLLLFPAETEHFFMFKNSKASTSEQGDTISQHDLYGWELHIAMNKGVSVMEFYRRHGDPMTVEELEFLMAAAAKKISSGGWKFSGEINIVKQWSFEAKDGKISDKTRAAGKNLRDILPVSPTRFIYIEIPDEVLNDVNFKTSVIGETLVVKQREAHKTYRDHVAQKVKERAAKTSKNTKTRQSAPQKINVFTGSAMATTTQTLYDPQKGLFSIVKYPMFDVEIGNIVPPSFDKSIQMTTTIPLQKETAFGYTYETADKKIRAYIYKNAVLFIDAEFDKSVRAYMEQLYLKQSRMREAQAETSTSAF